MSLKQKLPTILWHAGIVTQVISISVTITALWYFLLWSKGIHFGDRGEGILAGAVLGILGINFVVTITQSLATLQEKTKTMAGFLLDKDLRSILKLRDERLPVILVEYQAIMSVLLVSTACAISYSDVGLGFFAVFVVSTIVSIGSVVTMHMQDSIRSPWFKIHLDRLFPGWESISLDDYFELNVPPTASSHGMTHRNDITRRGRRRRMMKK